MQTKLDYLLSRIQNKSPPSTDDIGLPEYEKSSLDALGKDTAISLFCNIVNCLSGKQVVLYIRH